MVYLAKKKDICHTDSYSLLRVIHKTILFIVLCIYRFNIANYFAVATLYTETLALQTSGTDIPISNTVSD